MQVQSTSQTSPITPNVSPVRQQSENLSPNTDLKQTQRVNPREAAADAKEVEKEVDGATQKLQDFVANVRNDIQFSVDKDSGQMVVKVVDKNTQDVLMQMPSKEALEIAKALDKFKGLLVKQMA